VVTSAPARAAQQAREAKAVFDESLAAEVMLQNAVALFEEWRLRPRDRTAHPGGNRAGRRSTRRLVAASRPEAARPLVSLILTVKNGMPFIRSAIESIRGQLYANLQLVVQDCMSDDGSSELLAGVDDIEVDLVREADGGIGDAVSRALSRCRGPIVGSIDSDNLLRPGALHRVAEHFGRFSAEAAVYGAVGMIDEAGANLDVFRPGRFNFLRVLECELVPPWSTAFFRRDALTEAFQSGAFLKTCADFSAWLHLGHLPIGYIDEPLGSTRLCANSMTCNVDAYEQFCNDKIEALSRYLAACKQKSLRQALLLHGKVGIYCWAAGSIAGLDPTRKDLVQSFIGRARAIAPTSARVADMSEKIDAMNSH
jgi:glycosyltransferase involved in cell wall biosynthesis